MDEIRTWELRGFKGYDSVISEGPEFDAPKGLKVVEAEPVLRILQGYISDEPGSKDAMDTLLRTLGVPSPVP